MSKCAYSSCFTHWALQLLTICSECFSSGILRIGTIFTIILLNLWSLTSRRNYKSAVKSKNKTKSAEAPHDIFSILFCRRWLRNLRNFGESVGRVGPVHSGLKNTKKIAIKNTGHYYLPQRWNSKFFEILRFEQESKVFLNCFQSLRKLCTHIFFQLRYFPFLAHSVIQIFLVILKSTMLWDLHIGQLISKIYIYFLTK